MAHKKGHPYSHTHVEHHADGSHTVHHVHESDSKKDVKGAVADHDGLMDHMMDHTSALNPGEAQANAGPTAPTPMAGPGPTPTPLPPAGPTGA